MYFGNVKLNKSAQWVERLNQYKLWVIEYSNVGYYYHKFQGEWNLQVSVCYLFYLKGKNKINYINIYCKNILPFDIH